VILAAMDITRSVNRSHVHSSVSDNETSISDLNYRTQDSGPVTSSCAGFDEDRFRRRLKYFFMNPYQKWAAKRKIPWKLFVQFLKVFLVTVQVLRIICKSQLVCASIIIYLVTCHISD
jgi:hypothetical protein